MGMGAKFAAVERSRPQSSMMLAPRNLTSKHGLFGFSLRHVCKH